ncbi:SDR family NAD(P)-dependent oxidoreductase [Nocardia sp. NPDC004722]
MTGAARGIGAATARRLAAEGARLVLVDIDADGLEVLAREFGDGTQVVTADVASSRAWESVRDRALETFGGIDVLVGNAYALTKGVAHELPEAVWDRVQDVTLKSAYLGLAALGPALLKSNGSIVFVSSVHATLGMEGFSAYAAAKGGLTAYTRQLAVEYGGRLRVNAVLPGPIHTPSWDDADETDFARAADQTAVGRLGRAEEVADAIAFLASDEASFITGAALPVDGGMTVKRIP